MKIIFESNIAEKSFIHYDMNGVSTYGRYVLLFYLCQDRSQKAGLFQSSLSFSGRQHASFIVKARLRMSDDGYESDSDRYSQCSSSSSTTEGESFSFRRTKLFWIVLARFEEAVSGIDVLRISDVELPFCLVKRDLNYGVNEWIDGWQKWMSKVALSHESIGSPISCSIPRKGAGAVIRSSPYFAGTGRKVPPSVKKRRLKAEEEKSSGLFSTGSKLREGLLEHRVRQLEDRIRGLEDVLSRLE